VTDFSGSFDRDPCSGKGISGRRCYRAHGYASDDRDSFDNVADALHMHLFAQTLSV
jgi:hypothetical protein